MFRDPHTFACLRFRALPQLVAERAAQGIAAVRAWVAGCSTGEEAYSLAMCLIEAAEKLPSPLEIVVLASDVDASALALAARGEISSAVAASVPEPLAQRWLIRDGQGFRVAEELRRRVVFVQHDILDPSLRVPSQAVFAAFDLVSCRNLLIYLDDQAQAEVTDRLVGACEPGSILVLGGSESMTESVEHGFERLGARTSIYRRR